MNKFLDKLKHLYSQASEDYKEAKSSGSKIKKWKSEGKKEVLATLINDITLNL